MNPFSLDKNEVRVGHPACQHLGLLIIKSANKAMYQMDVVSFAFNTPSETTGGLSNKQHC